MSIKTAAEKAYETLNPTHPFDTGGGRLFAIDDKGEVHVIGCYLDPDDAFDDVMEHRRTVPGVRYLGIEWGGIAREQRPCSNQGPDEQRVYVVVVIDRQLEAGVLGVFERDPSRTVFESNPEGRLIETMKNAMACVVIFDLTDQ